MEERKTENTGDLRTILTEILNEDIPQEALAEGNKTPIDNAVDFMEQEIEKVRRESEEYGYRRGCIETCDLYFDGEGKEDFLKFWKEKQERELEIIKQLN